MPILSLPANLESITIVNDFIAKQLPEEYQGILMQVELAAEELLVNVFSYAYPNFSGDAEIGCRVVYLDGKDYFCFSVKDWGKPFNPFKESGEPDLSLGVEDRPIGGLGVYLIKEMVSHYAYSYSENENFIEIFFATGQPED